MEAARPINKNYLYVTLFLAFLVFASYNVNISSLVLFAVLAVSVMMFFTDLKTATCMLFLFSSFSYIIVYNTISLIIIVVVAYIFKVMVHSRVDVRIVAVACIVFGYCMLFGDRNVSFKLGGIICIMFFILIGIVCSVLKAEDFKDVFKWYVIGFTISAIMGMFTSSIPSLAAISNIDYLAINKYTTQDNMYNTIRYAGLSYDPNFFSMSVCVIVSGMLFGLKEKMNLRKLLVVLFLTIAGFFTYSKSYIIMITAVYAIYFLKNDKNSVKKIFLAFIIVGILIIIERYLNLGVIENIVRRFKTDNSSGNLTTGRAALWREYYEYITNDARIMLFGKGYNANSLKKAVHNTYMEYWYHFGFFGCILWLSYFLFCYSVIKTRGKKMIVRKNAVPMIAFASAIFFLNSLKFEHTWLLLCVSLYSLKSVYAKSEVQSLNEDVKCNSSGV